MYYSCKLFYFPLLILAQLWVLSWLHCQNLLRIRCFTDKLEWRWWLDYYSATDRGAEYCDERVCLSIRVFVSVRDNIFGTARPIYAIFCTWPWLGTLLAAYFRFYWWRHICTYAEDARSRRQAQAARLTHSLLGAYSRIGIHRVTVT